MRHDLLAVLPVDVKRRIAAYLRHPAIEQGVPARHPARHRQYCRRCGEIMIDRCTYRRAGTTAFYCAACGKHMCPAIVSVGPLCLAEGACHCLPDRVVLL